MTKEFLFLLLGASVAFAEVHSVEDCQLMKNKKMEMSFISANISNTDSAKLDKSKKLVCSSKMCAVVTYNRAFDLQDEVQSMIDAQSVYEKAYRNCKAKRIM